MSKEAASVETSSDAVKENFCVPCLDVGDHHQAVKFCIDCAHLVCQSCVDCHRRFRHMKGHKLVGIREEDLKLAQMMSRLLICPFHPDKTIELVCKNHDMVCCLTCATVSHRGCNRVVEITREAFDVKKTSVASDLQSHLTAASDHMTNIMKLHEKCVAEFIVSTYVAIPKTLHQLKKNIMEAFAALEQGILSELTKQRVSHAAKHDDAKEKWSKHIEAVNEAVQLLASVQKTGSPVHMYVVACNLRKTLHDVDAAIANQGNTLQTEIISLKLGVNSQKVLSSKPCGLAELCVTKTTTSLPEYKCAQTVTQSKDTHGYASYMGALQERFRSTLSITKCPYCHKSWQFN